MLAIRDIKSKTAWFTTPQLTISKNKLNTRSRRMNRCSQIVLGPVMITNHSNRRRNSSHMTSRQPCHPRSLGPHKKVTITPALLGHRCKALPLKNTRKCTSPISRCLIVRSMLSSLISTVHAWTKTYAIQRQVLKALSSSTTKISGMLDLILVNKIVNISL